MSECKRERERGGARERESEIFFAEMRRIYEIVVSMDLEQIESLLKLIRVPKYVRSKSVDVDSKFIAGHKLIF